MKTSSIALLAIAVVTVGIFALPSTVSLFSGQHTWYDLGDDGSQVPCMKCHGDIEDEMIDADNGVHRNLSSPGCDCHRVSGTGVADGDDIGGQKFKAGTTSHAAETIACMLCHEYDTRTGETYPFAGGFNTTLVYEGTSATDQYNYSWADGINDSKSGRRAAHNDFITEAIKDDLMTDSNEACIACHTRIGVNITWTKSTTMHFNASETPEGVWEIDEFTASGEDVYNSSYPNNWTS